MTPPLKEFTSLGIMEYLSVQSPHMWGFLSWKIVLNSPIAELINSTGN